MSLAIIAEEKNNIKSGVIYEWRTSRGVVAMGFLSKEKALAWGATMKAKHGDAWTVRSLVKVTTTITEEQVEQI